jgi:hypothetical protein
MALIIDNPEISPISCEPVGGRLSDRRNSVPIHDPSNDSAKWLSLWG